METVTQHATLRSRARAAPHLTDRLTDRLIVGDGCRDAVWLPWLKTLPTASVALEDLVPGGRRLVVVAPHPDDEILACGALIAQQIGAAQKVLVVYVTDGDASHGRIGVAARQALGQTRRLESTRGLLALGAKGAAMMRLGIPDGAIAGHHSQLWSRLLQIVQPRDVVVTTWLHDGHPDHEATARVTRMACALVGCKLIEAPVWMWHWSQPDDARIPFYRLVGLPVPLRVAQAKHAALLCHESQLKVTDMRATPVLGQAICERVVRPFEYYFASGDLLERL